MRAIALAAVLVLLAIAGGCEKFKPPAILPRSGVQQIRARGELRVVTLNLPTCYYLGAQGTEGLEFDLASRLCRPLGVKLQHVSGPQRARRAGGARRRPRGHRRRLPHRAPPTGAGRRCGRTPTPSSRSWWSTREAACVRATRCSSSRQDSRCAPAARRSASSQQLQAHRGTDAALGANRAELADPIEDVESGGATTRSPTRASSPSRVICIRTCWWDLRCPTSARCSGSCACCPGLLASVDQFFRRPRRRRAACHRWCRRPPATRAASTTRSRASSRPTWPTACRAIAPGSSKRPRTGRHRLATAGRGRLPGIQVGPARRLRRRARRAS